MTLMAELLETAQLALFPGAPASLSVEEVAKVLFGKSPERIESRPAEGVQTASVPHLGGNFQISVNPLRVDVIYQAGPSQAFDGPPVLGTKDIAGVRKWISEITPKLLKVIPPINRAGVVVARSEEFDTQAASVLGFSRAVPSDVKIPGDVVELALQFNRPRPATTFSGSINVMYAWQNLARQDISFTNTGFSHTTKYSVRSMIDVNTPPGEPWAVAVLATTEAPKLVCELIDIAFKNA